MNIELTIVLGLVVLIVIGGVIFKTCRAKDRLEFYSDNNIRAVGKLKFYPRNVEHAKGIATHSNYSLVQDISEVSEYAECPYGDGNIRATFHVAEIVKCTRCGVFHHKDCFDQKEKCGSFYCSVK